jgi:hypothetical protein
MENLSAVFKQPIFWIMLVVVMLLIHWATR